MAIPHVDLDAVRAHLIKMELSDPSTAPRHDEEGEPLWDPAVVFESIDRDDFRVWLKGNSLRQWWYEPLDEDDDRVVVYSRSSNVQAVTAGEVIKNVIRPLVGCTLHVMDTLRLMAAPTCELADRDQEPDMSFTSLGSRVNFPNVVVEVKYENVTRLQLEEKLHRWMGEETSVQVAIAIKIYKGSRNHIAILHVRDDYKKQFEDQSWPRIVPFGKSIDQPPALQFPLRALYHGGELPPLLKSHELEMVSINLSMLRSHIDECIEMQLKQDENKEQKKRSAEGKPVPAELHKKGRH